MKIKIKSFNGELPDYLTVGTDYEVVESEYLGFYNLHSVYDDEDVIRVVSTTGCDYLNGGSWEIVE